MNHSSDETQVPTDRTRSQAASPVQQKALPGQRGGYAFQQGKTNGWNLQLKAEIALWITVLRVVITSHSTDPSRLQALVPKVTSAEGDTVFTPCQKPTHYHFCLANFTFSHNPGVLSFLKFDRCKEEVGKKVSQIHLHLAACLISAHGLEMYG